MVQLWRRPRNQGFTLRRFVCEIALWGEIKLWQESLGKPRLLMQNGVDPCKLRWDTECTSFPPQEAPGRGWEAEMASWVSQSQAVKHSPGTNLPVYIFIIVVHIIILDLWTNWMFWNFYRILEVPKKYIYLVDGPMCHVESSRTEVITFSNISCTVSNFNV